VSVVALDKMISSDGFPFHIGADGRTDDRLPWRVQAYHAERYCDRFAEVSVDEIAQRPVVRLSMDDERAAGRSPITVEDGLETLAVFRDLGIEQIDIEVPWEQANQIEARLT
jgi:hypothetical protein